MCPGYWLSLDELELLQAGVIRKYSLCHICVNHGCRFHIEERYWHKDSLQDVLFAYVVIIAFRLSRNHGGACADDRGLEDQEESDADDWNMVNQR